MPKKCNASGDGWACDSQKRTVKGLCESHYAQVRKGKPLTPLRRYVRVLRHDPGDMFNEIPHGHKRCTRCSKVMPIGEFHKNRGAKDGADAACKHCALDSWHGEGASAWKVAKLEEQGGVCAMCESPRSGGQGWHLDHDHETGEWRDVLCVGCNIAFGQIEKSLRTPAMLAHLRKYGIELRRIA